MFQMFGFGGVKCPRCEHKNAGEAGYCAECGLTLGAPRSEPILRDNRWIPADNELAVFFGVRALSGLFVKTLRVPATTRAYILQGDKATEVPQGEYEIEGFFTRLNHLLRDQHAEILITRASATAVDFLFDELPTAEHLQVSARFSVSVKVDQVSAFARHFMTQPGTVTSEHLRALLAPSVRQLAAEFIGGQSMRDMAKNRDLRPQLDERIQADLKLRLAQYGLAVVQVDTLALRHDKFDSSRERIGSLFLVADDRHVQLEHAKHIDQLYNDEEWQRIFKEEQDARLRFRRQELRQDESIDKAELTLQNAERLQAVRAREIDLYARIVEARNRKDALERGAGDMVSELEHELAKKGAAREDESMEWGHLRELAGIRMRTELEIAQQGALESRQLAQQRFAHQLLQQQIQNKIVQALGIEDEARKRAELVQLHARQHAEAQREMAIEEEQHKATWQSLALVNAAHKREAERIAEWEDQLALDRKRDLMRGSAVKDEEVNQKLEAMRRSGAEADAVKQYEKLLRTIAADGMQSRQAQEIELDAEQARHTLKQQERETEWQQELRRLDHVREEKYTLLAHEAELERIAIARNESIGAMSDTAKLALAAAPNAAALADFMKTQVHAGMSADQLTALGGVSPAQAAQEARAQVEREQARRDAEVDKDRRHQLDLLAMQNDVNKTALKSQAELGAGIVLAGYDHAPRTCPNGHRVEINDKFCPECGAALHP
ncbi:MAG: SPFH domain-containing protein [Pseudomonadota bacterium]